MSVYLEELPHRAERELEAAPLVDDVPDGLEHVELTHAEPAAERHRAEDRVGKQRARDRAKDRAAVVAAVAAARAIAALVGHRGVAAAVDTALLLAERRCHLVERGMAVTLEL